MLINNDDDISFHEFTDCDKHCGDDVDDGGAITLMVMMMAMVI